MRQYFVYIVASPSRTIYTGVTNNLERRMWEHKTKAIPGFTARYGCDRLVHMEDYAHIDDGTPLPTPADLADLERSVRATPR